MDCSMTGLPFPHHLPKLPKFMSIASVMPSSHLIIWCPLLPPSISPSIREFSNEFTVHIKWPKYWRFRISPSNEYSGLISFRTYWLDLLSVQGTLWILLLYHSLKASILWHSAFFLVQLSQPYKTIGKTIVLTTWTFVSRLMSLLFNTFYRCHSFPARKQLSSDFTAAVTICSDFTAQEEEVCYCSTFPPSICHEIMGLDTIVLLFLFVFNIY